MGFIDNRNICVVDKILQANINRACCALQGNAYIFCVHTCKRVIYSRVKSCFYGIFFNLSPRKFCLDFFGQFVVDICCCCCATAARYLFAVKLQFAVLI